MDYANKKILRPTLFFLICACVFILLWGCANRSPKDYVSPKLKDSDNKEKKSFAVKYDFGYSVEKQKIQGTVIGDGGDVTLIIASIHGDESAGTPFVHELKKYLVRNPHLLQGRKVVIMDNVNPDGLIRGSRENARRVDINHDFSSPHPQPETQAIMQTIKYFRPARIISIRQLNSIDYDGPGADRLAEHLERNCNLRIKRWGTTPGSLGNYGIENRIPLITFGLPAKNMSPEQLWQKYGKALLASVTYGKAVIANSSQSHSVSSPVSSINTEKPKDDSAALQKKNIKLEKLYQKGISYFNARKPKDALRQFEEILTTDSTYKASEVRKYIQYAKDFIRAEEEVARLR